MSKKSKYLINLLFVETNFWLKRRMNTHWLLYIDYEKTNTLFTVKVGPYLENIFPRSQKRPSTFGLETSGKYFFSTNLPASK
jgi:hypothetical protein